MVRQFLVLALIAGCGRIGYEPRLGVDGSTTDTPVDAAATCPPDTTPVTLTGVAATALCIENTERGTKTWVDAKAECEAVGRRLCLDAEWASACDGSAGLVDMTDGNWEWVAEEAGGVAQKRGAGACADMSAHAIDTDPYDYRCCVDL